jgi:hypothetical protein
MFGSIWASSCGQFIVGCFVCSCVYFGFEGLRVEGLFGSFWISSCGQFCLFLYILPVYIEGTFYKTYYL